MLLFRLPRSFVTTKRTDDHGSETGSPGETRSLYLDKKEKSHPSEMVKSFPKDVYTELVGSLWSIYHEAKLIQPEHIEETVNLVDTYY